MPVLYERAKIIHYLNNVAKNHGLEIRFSRKTSRTRYDSFAKTVDLNEPDSFYDIFLSQSNKRMVARVTLPKPIVPLGLPFPLVPEIVTNDDNLREELMTAVKRGYQGDIYYLNSKDEIPTRMKI